MKLQLKQDKGTAGLTILLSLIVMLFIIGLIAMIFTIMGSKLQASTYDRSSAIIFTGSTNFVNETGTLVNGIDTFINSRTCLATITSVKTGNATQSLIGSTNYTASGCYVYCSGCRADLNNTAWNVTGTYTYLTDNAGTLAINETTSGIAGVTTWFPLFIVIGAMVVLILLTVIIITAIRQSGMIGGAGYQSGEGTA